jgi:hypothetical protein
MPNYSIRNIPPVMPCFNPLHPPRVNSEYGYEPGPTGMASSRGLGARRRRPYP